MTLSAPTSPCIQVCTLDERAYCLGCYRHLEEIARWGRMSAEEQWAVIAALGERRRQREKRVG